MFYKFSGTRVCTVDFTKFPNFPVKIGLFRGVVGPPNIFSSVSQYLCYLGAHTNFQNPMISLSGIYLKLARFPFKIGLIGHRGSPKFFSILIFLFMLLESPLKNSGPYDKSSWDIFEIRPFSGQNRVN